MKLGMPVKQDSLRDILVKIYSRLGWILFFLILNTCSRPDIVALMS